jgi:hypothetical protein
VEDCKVLDGVMLNKDITLTEDETNVIEFVHKKV